MKIKHSQVVAANNEIVAKAKELLCDGGLRAKCFEAATLGKQYTADLLASAQKAVVVTAVKIAAERLARRARTGNAETPLHRRLDHYKREKAARFLKLYAEDVKAFRQAVHGQFRTATAGDHRTRVGIATVPGDIGAKGESCKGAAYSRRCWYRRTDSNHEYEIPPNWRKTVEQPGLAVLDGMVTLSAELECDQDGIQIYRAVWVRQGRGFSLETRWGWIARRSDGMAYHSPKSAAAAVVGLRRKVAWQAIPTDVRASKRAEQRMKQLERLTERLQKYDISDIADIEVTYEDSRKAGNCHDGTVGFGRRLFGDARRKSTMGEMVRRLKALGKNAAQYLASQVGRQFVAACLHAIRRQRQTARLSDKRPHD